MTCTTCDAKIVRAPLVFVDGNMMIQCPNCLSEIHVQRLMVENAPSIPRPPENAVEFCQLPFMAKFRWDGKIWGKIGAKAALPNGSRQPREFEDGELVEPLLEP